MSDYLDLYRYFDSLYESVNGYDFYQDIFPDNENQGELNTDFSKPNAVYLYKDDDGKMKRRIMLNDTWEDDYVNYIERNSMTLCSGLSYRGRTNKLDKAQKMHALIFDLDGVGLNELYNIIHLTQFDSTQIRSIPMPTYIVLSGTGLHLYYVFDCPIDLYPNIKLQLKALKYDLTFRFWNPTITSKEKQIQYQSINQAFRMVGSVNSKHDTVVTAFRTGKRYSLSELNAYADRKEHMVDINKPFRPTHMTISEAKEKFPEWYQRVVIDGKKRAKKWDIKGKQGYALYNWWRNHVTNIRGGHRYFYLMCLSIYACKCDVPFSKLKRDMEEDLLILQKIEHTNDITSDDMKSALECYSREYYNFKIDDIEKLTDIKIERNKRNYRNQELHLRIARANRDILCIERGKQDWRDGNGRKPKKDIVKEWKYTHPNGKKVDCIKDTGLSKPTVYKWWNE